MVKEFWKKITVAEGTAICLLERWFWYQLLFTAYTFLVFYLRYLSSTVLNDSSFIPGMCLGIGFILSVIVIIDLCRFIGYRLIDQKQMYRYSTIWRLRNLIAGLLFTVLLLTLPFHKLLS